MKNDTNRPYRDKPYFRWGITALVVIIISILLVVIFTDIPGFFSMLNGFGAILSPLIYGVVFAFLLNPLVKFVDTRLAPALEKGKESEGALFSAEAQPRGGHRVRAGHCRTCRVCVFLHAAAAAV